MKIRALIADDEPPARERVRHLLREHTDIEILGECGDGPEAVAAVKEYAPDLLFLDVQMPGLDGFGVLAALPQDKLPVVIFTTAYDQHAVRAFDAHALDYLLKPFKPARFKEAVQRAREHLAGKQAGAQTQNLIDLLARRAAPHLTRIPVKTGERVIFVRVRDIECIESAGNYVVLHTGGEQHVLRETLTDLESQLDPASFLRVSRSALVNLNHVKELQPMFKGDHAVILHSGRSIPMTRGLREVERALRFG
ncbi:MAG TPA: response regulator [Verrucomicrobiales bacterium]|nr:response regulator [Verrucomicrobiales bacterium]